MEVGPVLYVVSTVWPCWDCKAETPVAGLLGQVVVQEQEQQLCMLMYVKELPESVRGSVYSRFPTYRLTYSLTVECEYFANKCRVCDQIWGDHYVYRTPGGPLCPADIEEIPQLELEKIPLAGPVTVEGSWICGSVYPLILEYARRIGNR